MSNHVEHAQHRSGRHAKRETIRKIDMREFRKVRSLICFHSAPPDVEARNREKQERTVR